MMRLNLLPPSYEEDRRRAEVVECLLLYGHCPWGDSCGAYLENRQWHLQNDVAGGGLVCKRCGCPFGERRSAPLF